MLGIMKLNYAPKNLSNSNTKNAGHNMALINPQTPIQNPFAEARKYTKAPTKAKKYTPPEE